MNQQTLKLAALTTLLLATGPGSTAIAQKQAAQIQFLTTVPVHKGYEKIAAVKQYPNKGKLSIAEGMQIKPPFAWNRDDKYVAPDFTVFFPDDREGGKQLDALFTGKLGGNHTLEDVLAAVRQGLRNTTVYKSQILAQVGTFVWNANEQDPRAIELLYHASDVRGPVTHEAMYHGLTVLKNRTPNVVRTITENFEAYDGNLQWRIGWGMKTYGDRQQTASLLSDILKQPEGLTDNAVIAALDTYTDITGEVFSEMKVIASRGRFVIGFSGDGLETEEQLRGRLQTLVGEKDIADFVLRIADGLPVGVGLVNGVGNREKMRKLAETDSKIMLHFAETFSPAVLRSRQLREFAAHLAEGLPSGARPNYAPLPKVESFTWNSDDGYTPPDYAAYFPIDEEGGKALDELFDERETTEMTAREQLNVIRNGLRTTKHGPRLCGWIRSIPGWPSDPMVTEIMYHAADPKAPSDLRYNSIYFGLSGRLDYTPNVLRLFSEIILTEEDHPRYGKQTIDRIAWSIRKKEDKAMVAKRLNDALVDHEKYTPERLNHITRIYEQLTGEKPSTYEQYSGRGTYFVMFSHRRLKSVGDLTAFCEKAFGRKTYFEKSVIGSTGKIQGMALVFVKGANGLEQSVNELKAIDSVRIEFAGLESLLKRSPEWQSAIRGGAEPKPAEYVAAFNELHKTLGQSYAHFEIKNIDWQAVGREFQPRSEKLKTRAEFCRLCQELVARLEDSHAFLFKGAVEPESPPVALWDPGFACLFDAEKRPVVYYVDPGSPAANAGLKVGMIVTHINDVPASDHVGEKMNQTKKYAGYSSDRYLRYHTGQWLGRQMEKNSMVQASAVDVDGKKHEFQMKAALSVRYLPRLPVPIEGIKDSASVSWKRLDEKTGYIYVRKIRGDLPDKLDAAVADLQDCEGLIIDVRGNSGGGFDAARAVRNFNLSDKEEPKRPRFQGRIAVLIDSRCISAGEGWVSWFRANNRAKFFGQTTAGASSRKTTIDVMNGDYKVIYSVKAYRGFLDRPIERIGIEPDVEVYQTAAGLAQQTDAVLAAAISYLNM